MEKKFKKLHILPWLFFIVMTVSLIILYVWSTLLGDVPAFLPYVSDAGGHPPQSALFGIALIAGVFIALSSCLIKYFTVEDQNINRKPLICILNYLSLLNAILVVVGMVVVATNPLGHLRRDKTWVLPVLIPHLTGAAILFGNGCIYFIIQAIFAWSLGAQNKSPMLGYARIAANLVSCVGLLMFALFVPLDTAYLMKPSPDHATFYPGNSVWSSVGEWIMIFGLLANILTLAPDLRKVTLTIVVESSDKQEVPENSNSADTVLKF